MKQQKDGKDKLTMKYTSINVTLGVHLQYDKNTPQSQSLLHLRQAQAAITDSDGEETPKAVCCKGKELWVFLECEVTPISPV